MTFCLLSVCAAGLQNIFVEITNCFSPTVQMKNMSAGCEFLFGLPLGCLLVWRLAGLLPLPRTVPKIRLDPLLDDNHQEIHLTKPRNAVDNKEKYR